MRNSPRFLGTGGAGGSEPRGGGAGMRGYLTFERLPGEQVILHLARWSADVRLPFQCHCGVSLDRSVSGCVWGLPLEALRAYVEDYSRMQGHAVCRECFRSRWAAWPDGWRETARAHEPHQTASRRGGQP